MVSTPEPYIHQAEAKALRHAADVATSTEVLFRRHDGTPVTIAALLREMADTCEQLSLTDAWVRWFDPSEYDRPAVRRWADKLARAGVPVPDGGGR